MARRKVNINTFNPNAGVSIPGWAVESYKDTVDTVQDIVGDITKEADRSRKDNMQFALESSRIAQRQREFEYKKDQDEYNIGRQNFIDSTSDFGNSPDDLDALEAILNNLPATGNQNLSDFYQSQRENVKRTRKVNAGIKENIRNFMLGGLDDASLKETGRDVFLDSWTMQAIKDPTGWNKNQTEYMFKQAFPQYNPDFLQSEIFKNGARAANDIFALAITQEPGSAKAEEYFNKFNNAIQKLGGQTGAIKGDIDFDMTSDFLMQYAKDSGQDLADVNLRAGQDKDGLMSEINTFYSKPEDKEAGRIEQFTDYIEEIFSSEPKEASGPVTISYRGKEAIAIPGSEKTDSAGNLSYELEYEDGSRERVDARGISGQLPEGFGEQEDVGFLDKIASMEFPEEYKDRRGQFYVDKAYDSFLGLADYLSGAKESADKSIKDFEGEFKLLDTKSGKFVDNFLTYIDDIYKDVEDDSNPNLTPIGKKVNQVGKTIGRFFPQIVEDYQIFKSGQIDKYLTEGTSTVEAIKKARDDIRESQGGYYYTKAGKYITKKQLIGQGNMLLPSEDFDAQGNLMKSEDYAKLENLPNKMINPKYIEDKVIELSASMAEDVSKVSETSIAGPALKKVKNNLSKTEKELRKLKKEVEEVEKYRAPEFYKVSSEQIDNALETIKIAKSKRESRVKNPFPNLNEAERQRVSESDQQNVNRSVEEMREAEALLQRLLNEQATSNIFPETSFLSSPNPNNPFGR